MEKHNHLKPGCTNNLTYKKNIYIVYDIQVSYIYQPKDTLPQTICNMLWVFFCSLTCVFVFTHANAGSYAASTGVVFLVHLHENIMKPYQKHQRFALCICFRKRKQHTHTHTHTIAFSTASFVVTPVAAWLARLLAVGGQ